jgi:hypothetical protein
MDYKNNMAIFSILMILIKSPMLYLQKSNGTRSMGPNVHSTCTCPNMYNQQPITVYRTKMDFVSKVKLSVSVVYEKVSVMSLHRLFTWFMYIYICCDVYSHC